MYNTFQLYTIITLRRGAGPVDSIRIDTGIISVVDYTRERLQFDKDRLQKTTP
jgi:hypothetical protein